MAGIVSAKTDTSSVRYKGRAIQADIRDFDAMADEGWRARLAAAVAASGKSKREISLASKNGPGYVHGILKEGKEPRLDKLLAVLDKIPASVSSILVGVELGPDEERFLRHWAGLPDEEREALRRLVLARSGPQDGS